jgi:hypothetical protein
MTSFEVGFLKYAEECGLSDDQAAHILKRALDYPGTADMFKTLPQKESTDSPEDLAVLANMLKQELVDKQFDGAVQQIKV